MTQIVDGNLSLKILAASDLHLGRPSARVPAADFAPQSSERLWMSLVQLAIREQVVAVALAGDIIEHSNRFFEAIGTLERGLRQLAEHGIPTYAVAGNHDWDVLPRAVEAVGTDYFHLLGRGGNWESVELCRNGKAILRFQGWSFTSSHFSTSPLAGYSPPSDDGVPTIALLHCDLDQLVSRYAPVSLAELKSLPVNFWLLGHVHAPKYHDNGFGPPVLYAGSPQALDPGEGGSHGPWLLEVHGPRHVTARQINLSAVRYEQVEIDITGIGAVDAAESRIYQTVRDTAQQLGMQYPALEWLILRLRLKGRTAFGRELDDMAERLQQNMSLPTGDLRVHIDAVSNDTCADIDMEAWSRRKDVPGALAKLILQWESGINDPEPARLLDLLSDRLQEVYESPAFRGVNDGVPDREEVRRRLLRQAWRLLETLRAQEASA